MRNAPRNDCFKCKRVLDRLKYGYEYWCFCHCYIELLQVTAAAAALPSQLIDWTSTNWWKPHFIKTYHTTCMSVWTNERTYVQAVRYSIMFVWYLIWYFVHLSSSTHAQIYQRKCLLQHSLSVLFLLFWSNRLIGIRCHKIAIDYSFIEQCLILIIFVPFNCRFQYVLAAATSIATKNNEETITYLNQGQSYEIKLKKLGDLTAYRGKILKVKKNSIQFA